MPVFELNGKKVCYGLDQEDGKVLIDTEDAVEALGYSAEVVKDIRRGAAADVLAEIGAVADRQFGPPEGDIEPIEIKGYMVRFHGEPSDPESRVCLTDYIKAIGGKPIEGKDAWVTYLDWCDWILTRFDSIHSERTMLDGISIRCQDNPFVAGEKVYSINDIVDSIDGGKAPLPYDEGWATEEQAMRLIRTARRGWHTFKTTGKVPDQEVLGTMLEADPTGETTEAHQMVAERILGRPLRENEYVVCKNGDPYDLRRSNLEIRSR